MSDSISSTIKAQDTRFAERNPTVTVWAFALLACLTLLGAATLSAWMLRSQSESSWKAQLANLSTLIAGHSQQTMFSSYTVLDSLTDYAKKAPTTVDEYKSFLSSQESHDLLKNRIAGNPIIDVATFTDDQGNVLNFTRSYPSPKINLSDRDYFKAHKNDSTLKTFLSVPVQNKGNGQSSRSLNVLNF